MLCANETFIFYKLLCFSHPLGALPMGTIVHIIKKIPGEGRRVCQACWASAQVLRKVGDKAILRLPSKHEIALSFNCMVTEGQVFNSGHDDIPWKGVGEKMSAGYRPKTNPTQSMRYISCRGTEVYVLFLWRWVIMLNNNIILCLKRCVEIFLLPCCKNPLINFYSYKVCYF